MAEYTNIDAFAEDIRSRFCNKCNNALLAINCGDCWVDKALLEIENAPTADVIEIQHGKWIPQIVYGERVWVCSKCQTIGSPRWNVCPVCVAKMDGKGDGE